VSDNIPSLTLDDQRKVVVNGRRYFTMTATKCTTCDGDDHFMFLKQRLSGGCCTLECPRCDSIITLKSEMVNWRLGG
jgi:hypothetical protein